MGQFVDFTGRVFDRLTVLRRAPNHDGRVAWTCHCVCGKECVGLAILLRTGMKRSCGCLHSEVTAARNTKHGAAKRGEVTSEFAIWSGMISRCYDPKTTRYPQYGGRGIAVCDEWRTDFAAFLAHVGPRPSSKHSIDRIDNDRGYEPGNVRWATMKEQCRNRRNNHYITIGTETMALAAWLERMGMSEPSYRYRKSKGWTDEKVLTTPPRR